MPLVGDVIIGARELIPDMPGRLPVPPGTAAVVSATGSTLPAGTYACVITQRNPWGETLGAAEVPGLVVGANQGIQITSALMPGATVIRAYLTLPGGAAGSEQQYVESIASPFTISTAPTLAALPPTRNSAWLPDTDGKRFSAGTLYRWLNAGLSRLARKAGGLQDYTGVQSISGQPLYVITGDWAKFTAVWYDGFPLGFGNQREFFRRNATTSSVLASAAITVRDNRNILEVFYQAARTAGSTTLSIGMAPTDTVANAASLTGFQSFGPPMLAQIGTEIVAFQAISGTQLTNLVRGLGGTTPQSWPIGTAVLELNIWLLGKRLFTAFYSPGNGANTLPLPVGWESILPEYIMNRSKKSEQEEQKSAGYLKEFDESIVDFLRANRQLAGPTQAGGNWGAAETVPGFGSSLGGVVLPTIILFMLYGVTLLGGSTIWTGLT